MADLMSCRLRVSKEEIYYMSWTIDAYEGVAFLRNESEEGVVSICCSFDYVSEARNIISAFAAEGIAIERISDFESEDI